MSKYPPKNLIFLIAVACLISMSRLVFCSNQQLTELQEQARHYRDQGWQLQSGGDLAEALTYYQKAMVLDPNYAVVYNDIGVIFEATGRIEEARQLYLKAIEMDPDYPNSYSNLALLYESEEDFANSILNWVKRATVGDPADPWSQAARKRLEDIARAHPEAYRQVGQGRITLFDRGKSNDLNRSFDSSTSAADYLKRAKQSFSRGDYVTALKEATLAEYLDSSNSEISAFVKKVRKTLLQ